MSQAHGPPTRAVVDVSALPDVAFGPGDPDWWGTVGFMVIEGATLALCAGTYFYLGRRFDTLPPGATPLPDVLLPTLNLVLLLASLVPAAFTLRAARRLDRPAVERSLAVGLLVMTAVVALRFFEFGSLHTRWDENAYGSITWFTLGFHFTLLLVNLVESAVIFAILRRGPREHRIFSDVADDAFYWFFVVLVWVPLYVIIFLTPRFP
ncbi:MAG TPA: cytochrome c oxidase subunit 3 [Longimicrobiales bacterium]|nr:cytochrome c oxidase subunit 3 [Longimicrobiales bacterium]